jgi:hypothetical protein
MDYLCDTNVIINILNNKRGGWRAESEGYVTTENSTL